MRRLPAALAGLMALLPSGPLQAALPDARRVGQAIAERRSRVAELVAIREAAEELGIRVWLFGGTAAGFAHYVRWDLAREGGDARYRESSFDYDFTNIYRSTQDADLVVDATPEQAAELESLIRQKMSFLQGSKDHWEVRLLREDRGVPGGQVKQALLRNPDFLEQHTDSNSTGMIELTDPPSGEPVVRDLRDWESPVPHFLRDVAEGRIHYYWSPTHEKTTRSRSGDNPPIFSAIRFLVKAFQYDLKVDGEDRRRVRAVIEAFDPEHDHAGLSAWAKGWLERYGPNLIRHAVNIEYARDTLDELGLREKLFSLSNPSQQGTLGWWLSREPLRTSAVGRGAGRTARELGLEVVAHDTGDFLAYESITRDTTLRPNVLISRPDHPGEAAALGPGFYTRVGRVGGAGTGLTIRFRVDPRAREGVDFSVHDQYVLFTNRAALRVIQESLEPSWSQYFEVLRAGPDRNDRGVRMKLRRRLSLRPPTEEEEEGIAAVVSAEIDRMAAGGARSPVLEEWVQLPSPERWKAYPELVERLRSAVLQAIQGQVVYQAAPRELLRIWSRLPASEARPLTEAELAPLMEGLVGYVERFAQVRNSTPEWLNEATQWSFLRSWLMIPFPGRSRLLEELVERGAFGIYELGDLPSWVDDPRVVLLAWARHDRDNRTMAFARNQFERILARPPWNSQPQLLALCGGAPTAACLERVMDSAKEDLARAFGITEAIAALSEPLPPSWCGH